jgi:hypothetical protein
MQVILHALRRGCPGTAPFYSTLCTRLYNTPVHHAMDLSALTAACNALIGQMLNFCAIATTRTTTGYSRFCVRMVTIVRTLLQRTSQPAAPEIGQSDFLSTPRSIRSFEP